MLNLPVLLPVQKALLIDLVEAAERIPSEERAHFSVNTWRGDSKQVTALSHPGLATNRKVFLGDIEVLAHYGLILVTEQPLDQYHKHLLFTLLPEAYLHYGSIKQPALPAARAAVRGVLQTTLENAHRARYVLERAAAIYASGSEPPHLAIQLEDKRAEIERLEQRLRDLDREDGSPA